ncbi:MAG: pyridoxamine 5'-phosphate oxidase [Bacteroidales bacterium]|nr:pyridoxamine 5'-phosphate oxidase [Bacteroidales bacterium]
MENKDLSIFRREYSNNSLNENDLPGKPIVLFEEWLNEAISNDISEPFAITLSTASLKGKPSSRVVLLRSYSESGFIFYTNYSSRKAIEIQENPMASMNFFWPDLDRQIIIIGEVSKTSEEESDAYFLSRPLESRISAVISEQSKPLPSRDSLENLFQKKMQELKGDEIIRPKNWGGFRLKPESIEFWQGRPHRLNDRILYQLENNVWQKQRLAP